MQQVVLCCQRMSGDKMKRRKNIIISIIVLSVFCLFGCSFSKDKKVKDRDVTEKDVVEKEVDEKEALDSNALQGVDDKITENSSKKEEFNDTAEETDAESTEKQKDSSSEVVDDTPNKEQNNNVDISDGIVLPEDEW